MRKKRTGVSGPARQQGARHKAHRVFVGLSGGVDSSVAALLLKQQGYEVIGVYMKNWSQDLPGMTCPWKEDYQDAKRVAVQLGIDFKLYDFEKQYQHKVVDYMIEEYKAGRTPNPDIMCNQEIKFKLFLDTAFEDGADLVATGHYAKIENRKKEIGNRGSSKNLVSNSELLIPRLLMAKDASKDQTYFLYRVDKDALKKVLFPLGDLTKVEVREIARQNNLITAAKKDSVGICFVGKVGIKDFLQQYIQSTPGKIVDQAGKQVGEHAGAIFYTIGQRHGLDVGGGLPYYVINKDMEKNEVYVTTDLEDEQLWSNQIKLTSPHWINGQPKNGQKIMVRIRHLAKLVPVKRIYKPAPHQNLSGAVGNRIVERQVFGAGSSNSQWVAELGEEVRALTPGQSAVFYADNHVLGGGIVV
jgi:tRNA-specific 2-thiouridylase